MVHMTTTKRRARRVRNGVRWLLRSRSARRRDRMRRRDEWERLFPDDPGFLTGVREPRRPRPSPPSDAVALDVPKDSSAGE
jgi:hypothetical protein